jgi:hypothetical protein
MHVGGQIHRLLSEAQVGYSTGGERSYSRCTSS